MDKDTLFQKLETVTNLPTLPAILRRLNQAVADPEANAARIAGIIQDDPAMMARILKVVNSAAYSSDGTRVVSLQEAVARLGLRGVQNVALSTSVFQTFSGTRTAVFSCEEFWRHSICVGIGVNILFEHTRENISGSYTPDILHLCGLLHDIGKIIFAHSFQELFAQALERSKSGNIPLFQAEREMLGSDHGEVGAWLAEKWNLSPEVAEAVRWHHDPENAKDEYLDLVRLCHTANYINCLEKIGDGGDNHAPVFIIGVWKRIGLRVKEIRPIVKKIIEQSKQSETLLAIMQN